MQKMKAAVVILPRAHRPRQIRMENVDKDVKFELNLIIREVNTLAL